MKPNRTAWAVVAVVGAYVACQAIADVGATKMILLGGVVLPAGSLVFALTFTIRDLVHKRLGKSWAQAAIVTAAVVNICQALFFSAMARIPAPDFFEHGEAWAAIFAIVPSITVASITAELVSELIDTEVYHAIWTKLPRVPQWVRVLVSNAVSLPVDSFVFGVLAFVVLPRVFGGDVLPVGAALAVVGGQIVYKALVTVVSLPGIYLVREKPHDVVI